MSNDVQTLANLDSLRRVQASRAIEHMLRCAATAHASHAEGETLDRVRSYVAEVKRFADFALEDLIDSDTSQTAARFANGKRQQGQQS